MSIEQLIFLIIFVLCWVGYVGWHANKNSAPASKKMWDLENSKIGRPGPLIHKRDEALSLTRFDFEMRRRRMVREGLDKASKARKG